MSKLNMTLLKWRGIMWSHWPVVWTRQEATAVLLLLKTCMMPLCVTI